MSVIIPCRDEAERIEVLLDAVRRQDYPVHEIIVIDGGSTDETALIVRAYGEQHPEVRLQSMAAPGAGISEALNSAIREARGDVVVRLDGHSLPRPDYVRRAVETLAETGAGVVGGVWTIAPGGPGTIAKAIALAVGHPMGAGDAAYRTGGGRKGDRTEADTVPFGCFLKSSWERIGGFNERLLTNEDYEFNYRMRESGSGVMLDPGIRCTYFARKSLTELAGQYFRYGWWKGQMLRAHPGSLRWRQAMPAALIPTVGLLAFIGIRWPPAHAALAAFVVLYLTAITAAAVQIGARERRWHLLALLVAAFGVVHWSWGAGVLVNAITAGRWPSWRPPHPLPPVGGEGNGGRSSREDYGFSGASLLLSLSCIFILAFVVPPGLATLVNRARIDRAHREVAELARQLERSLAGEEARAAIGSAELLGGRGNMPAVPDGSGWSTGRTATLDAYVTSASKADPWGNRYLVNIGGGAVWVLSAGPNGIVETPFRAAALSAALGGDDVGVQIGLNGR